MNAQTALADFVVGTATADVPDEVLAEVERALLDTLAAVLVGESSELADPLLSYATATLASGASPVIGSPILTSPERAALINGALGHAMDFDDTVSSMPGHPGAVVFSALLAVLPHTAATGREFMAAAAIGYEVATKLGRAIGMGHYNRGWHSTGTIGIFGAVAAVSRIRGLSIEQTRHALGIAASMASGVQVNFGTMTKPLHSGWAASSGLTAAMLAGSGYTASAGAINGRGGFFDVYGTPDSSAAVLAELGAPYTLVSPGVAFKKYACCYALHRAIDAIDQLRGEGALGDGARVRSIQARVAPGVLRPLAYRRPTTGLEGKFSMEYVLAAGVLDGQFGLEAFTDDAVRRPEIRRLLDITEAIETPECSPDDPEGRSASAGTRGFVEIVVDHDDGSRHARQVQLPPGSPFRPLSNDDIARKFDDSSRFSGFPNDKADQLKSFVRGLRDARDATPLIELVSAHRDEAAREAHVSPVPTFGAEEG